MKRNVSVVRFKFRCNILISGKIIKEMPGSVASGTPCIRTRYDILFKKIIKEGVFVTKLGNKAEISAGRTVWVKRK